MPWNGGEVSNVRPTLIYFGKKYTNANTNLGMEERCPVSPNFVYWSSCPYLYIELEADKIKR